MVSHPQWGTDPRKVQIGFDRAGKFKLYLYKCAKKGVFSVSFSSRGETEVKVDNFCKNLGKNRYFWSKSVRKKLFSGDIGGLFYM